ncbi:GNAT family N-acetyltransferase [Micrococcales bacterium 31B]|nr:GNAT family N-acetyltransferase [Micrococcales bacterium 31B]
MNTLASTTHGSTSRPPRAATSARPVDAGAKTGNSHLHDTAFESLQCLERYQDEVPRALASVELIGPFTLFVNESGEWPFYARPSQGARDFAVEDALEVLERQERLDVPQTFEWVKEITPELAPVLESAGLVIDEFPILRRLTGGQINASEPHGIEIRVVKPHDNLAKIGVVAAAAFGYAGAFTFDVDAFLAESQRGTAGMSRQIMEHLVTLVAAYDGDTPVAVAAANPRGDLAELIGVATLPAYRRRGLGLAVTAELTRELGRRGVHEIFVNAQEPDAATLYQAIGFTEIGTACIAEWPLDDD